MPAQGDRPMPAASGSRSSLKSYLFATLVTLAATLVCWAVYGRIDPANLIMIYLAGVAFVASRSGFREAFLAACLSVLLFDVLWVQPRFSLSVFDSQYLVTFGVMLGVALLISSLTLQVRRQAAASAERERRTAALYSLSKQTARARSRQEIALAAANEIRNVFDADAAVLLKEQELMVTAPSNSGFERDSGEAAAAAWCFKHEGVAGRGTETLPLSQGFYLPLRGSQGAVGVLALLPGESSWPPPTSERNLLETFANALGLAIERTLLAKESQEAKLQAESERVRNALLSSISHDLRTPLTSIAGAASSLKEGRGDTAALAGTIYEESVRLNNQVQNLLDMTRLQTGHVELRLEWQSAEEMVGSALERSKDVLKGRQIEVRLAPDLPLVQVDGELLQKVILNLLENVSAHTPAGSSVEISADNMHEVLRLNVADRGPGVAKGDENRIFERFFRRDESDSTRRFGLGLAICRAVMKVHKGRVWVENRSDGSGSVFHVEIPKPAKQPEVPGG
jgi:two-component system sensor histidine kinase KdpD